MFPLELQAENTLFFFLQFVTPTRIQLVDTNSTCPLSRTSCVYFEVTARGARCT